MNDRSPGEVRTPRFYGVTKRALEAESTMSLADALAAEARAQAACMEHFDFREAYEAFVAKRPARFE